MTDHEPLDTATPTVSRTRYRTVSGVRAPRRVPRRAPWDASRHRGAARRAGLHNAQTTRGSGGGVYAALVN